MKKLIVVAFVVYGTFALARAVPSMGVYVMILPVLAVLLFAMRGRSRNATTSGQDRARTRDAARAVRRGMSYADASRQFGVTERSIRRRRLRMFYLSLD